MLPTLLAALLTALPATAAPKRVMSLNVCTDQLAIELAAPGQLVSVSFLAGDPEMSALYREAARYPKNKGLAEEVFLARPDLVVTGTYSLHNTTALLQRLGIHVEEFPYTQTLETVPDDIRRMGKLLGQEGAAERIAASFERELKEITASTCGPAPSAVAFNQNGITYGTGTLGDSVLKAAGFRNLAADLGYRGVIPFPLELLVKHRPDVVIVPNRLGNAPSLADLIPRHPALAQLPNVRVGTFIPRGVLSCGAPSTMAAVRALARLRAEISPCAKNAVQSQ